MPVARLVLLTALLVAMSSAAFAHEEPAVEEPVEDPGWIGKVGLGASVGAGTTDTFSGSLLIDAERAWGANLVKLGLGAQYGKTKQKNTASVTNEDEQYLTQYYRRTLTERFYAYGEAEEARDSVRDIDLRLLLNAGPGYRAWIGENDAFLDLEAGIGYRYENYKPPTSTRNDVTGRAAFIYQNNIGPALFGQSGEFFLPFNDTGAWIARAETKLSFPILPNWSFDNTLGLEYSNKPALGIDEFELDYIVSLAYSF